MLVGRQRELADLERLIPDGTGGGALGVVVGEAGVGKSRLLAEVMSAARSRGVNVRLGRCFADAGERAYGPWLEALGARSFAAGELTPAAERARTFEEALGAIRAAGGVIALEDVQWADADTLRLLVHAARFALDRPLLLLVSVRDPDPDGAKHPHLDAALAELARIATWIALGPLDLAGVTTLAGHVGGGAAPQALARTLLRETGGNPLYVREAVRHLVETGRVQVGEGRLSTDASASDLDLPATVRQIVRRRLQRLARGTAEVLRLVAVAGAPVSLDVLARAADRPPGELLDQVDEAIAAGLLRGSSRGYEVTHALVGRAIAEEWNPDRRAVAHRRLAEAMAQAQAVEPGEVAIHYHASRTLPGAEAGARFALAAAEAARTSPDRAVTFLSLALDLVGPDGRADVVRRRALARACSGDPAAVDDAETAVALGHEPVGVRVEVARELVAAGAPATLWEPLVRQGLAQAGPGTLDEARLRVLGARPVPVLRGPLYVSRFAGFDPEAVARLRASGTERDFASTVDLHDRRDPDETEALLARIERWSDPSAILRVADACGRDLFFGERYADAHDRARAQLARSERAGSVVGQVGALVILGCLLPVLGRLEEAASVIERARGLSARIGAVHRMSAVGPAAAQVVLSHVLGADTAPAVLRGLVESPATATVPFGLASLNLALVQAATAGEADVVARLVPHHQQALGAVPFDAIDVGAGLDCGATAAWLVGLRSAASGYLALDARGRTGTACWTSAAHSRARLRLLVDPDGSLDPLADAVVGLADRPAAAALGAFDLAWARHRAGAPAAEALGSALVALRGLGMTGWVARAEALAPARPLPDGLSAREGEVLALLARGLANKEIAARLFVSVATVERHVANVYAKIGCRSRAAATAWAMRRGLVG